MVTKTAMTLVIRKNDLEVSGALVLHRLNSSVSGASRITHHYIMRVLLVEDQE